MSIKIPRVVTQNKELDTFQTQLQKSLYPVTSSPLNTGVMLTLVNLVSGDNVLQHGLGRAPVGYLVTTLTAPVTLYLNANFNPNNITIHSSGSAKASFWVF